MGLIEITIVITILAVWVILENGDDG